MNRLKLGVRLEALGLPFKKAIAEASKMGVNGVQFDAVGELSPNQISQTGRREIRHLLKSYNLELAALGCPLRHPLETEQDLQPRLEQIRRVLEMSFDLGPRFVMVEPGKLPQPGEPSEEPAKDKPALDLFIPPPGGGMPIDLLGGIDLSRKSAEIRKRRREEVFAEVMRDLSSWCDRTGTRIALQTGLNSGSEMREYLDRFDSSGLGVNFDPANFLLNGFDPYESARELRGKLIHVHAHDARRSKASRINQEVPVGQGEIDWVYFLAVLEEIEYRGFLTVEREVGQRRLADVMESVRYLRNYIPLPSA